MYICWGKCNIGTGRMRAGRDEYICEGRTRRVLARLDDWNYIYTAPAVHNCTAIYLLQSCKKKESSNIQKQSFVELWHGLLL